MEQSKSSSTAAIVGVVAVIVGLVVGFGGAKLMDNNKTSDTKMTSSTPTTSTKAADLRSTLVGLGVIHQDLTQLAVDSALDGSADAADQKAALIQNGTDISAAVGSVYGQSAQDAFQKIWNVHLVDFVNYAVAGKTGDAAGKAAALADIKTNYTAPIAKLLSGANPNLPEATLETAFGDHVTMTAAVIDDHNAGNYKQEATDQAAAAKHIQGLMSTLAGAIVQQYPSKF